MPESLIDWEQREFIVGRSGLGQGAKYGEAADVATNLKELEKIDPSISSAHGFKVQQDKLHINKINV